MPWPPLWALPWTISTSTPPPGPLPSGITRTHIRTPQGPLELLSTLPTNKPPPSPPSSLPHVLFLHGGFGSAAVWLPYLVHLSRTHNVPCHALSLRGHGDSWRIGYLRMVFGTGLGAMEEDVRSALEWLGAEYGQGAEVVVVGHSSGGGLAQCVLERWEGRMGVRVRGLALLAGTPCFGQVGVYWNWFKHDPLFFIRLLFHFGHPLSPLSSLALVKGAFFSPSVPERMVEEFRRTCMRGYESLVWPNQMMGRLVDPKRVLSNLARRENGGQKVLIVAGKRDKLMGTRLMQEMAAEYREAYRYLVEERMLEGAEHGARPKGEGTADQGIKYVELDVAHHMQNDIRWEEGAERLAEFLAQL